MRIPQSSELLATKEGGVAAARNRSPQAVRDLWVQDVAGRGDTLFAALEEYGLLGSSDAGKTCQHVRQRGSVIPRQSTKPASTVHCLCSSKLWFSCLCPIGVPTPHDFV